jgi:hypothetical protein
MRNVKRLVLSVSLCVLLSACTTDSTPAAGGDGGALEAAAAQDVAGGPQDAAGGARGPDATAGPLRAPDAAQDAPAAPDVRDAGQLEAELLDAGAAQVLDAGADQVEAGPLCPAGFYATGAGPGGGPLACDPKAPPGTLPCVNGRDPWCPNWCPRLTICGAYGWVCCQS